VHDIIALALLDISSEDLLEHAHKVFALPNAENTVLLKVAEKRGNGPE